MIWDDTGFLLSKNRYSENSLITEIYTKNHGKISGLIFGGTSKKVKIEIQQALSPIYFDDNKKLSCISLAMNLIRLLTAEAQKNQSIYELINDFYILLKEKNWIKRYVFWELDLFKVLGYDLEFSNLVDKKIHENQVQYISKSSIEKKIIPNFLIDRSLDTEDIKILLDGLKLVGDYLEKTILRPNNLTQPISRKHFISTLK